MRTLRCDDILPVIIAASEGGATACSTFCFLSDGSSSNADGTMEMLAARVRAVSAHLLKLFERAHERFNNPGLLQRQPAALILQDRNSNPNVPTAVHVFLGGCLK